MGNIVLGAIIFAAGTVWGAMMVMIGKTKETK